MYTIPSETLSLNSECPLRIIASLQTGKFDSTSVSTTTFNMDIEYIKIYKSNFPNDVTLRNSYKTSRDNVFINNFENIHSSSSFFGNVRSSGKSIASNPENPKEYFYINDYFRVVRGREISEKWQYNLLNMSDLVNMKAVGDIAYLPVHKYFIYIGSDFKIYYFKRIPSIGTTNYSSSLLLHDPAYPIDSQLATSFKGSLITTNDGQIFYIGKDNKIHWYYFNGIKFVHNILPHPTSSNSLSNGELTVDPNTNNIFYRGIDGKLQSFYKTSTYVYAHAWIDTNWTSSSKNISNRNYSLVWSNKENGIFYIGIDNKIHSYRFFSGTWNHTILPYTYSLPSLGFVDGDLVKSDLFVDNNTGNLFYTGYDGRIQMFYKNDSGIWHHIWVIDLWNNDDYNSFNIFDISKPSSSFTSTNTLTNQIFYFTNKDDEIISYKIDSCQNSIDTCLGNFNGKIFRDFFSKKDYEYIDTVKVFPNPADNYIMLKMNNNNLYDINVVIFDMFGVVVNKKYYQIHNGKIDISDLPSGNYILSIYCNEKNYQSRFVKL